MWTEIPVYLGTDLKTGKKCHLPSEKLKQHLHLIGGTGKGKTTAIHTLLHGLLEHPNHKACFFIIDRMGNLSDELLLWMASRFCPSYVRERLVYIEPAREDTVCPLHPLSYTSEANAYYRVKRATELILRSWTSQQLQEMPRLARWTYYAFMSAAYLRLALSDCWHFLEPHESNYHGALIKRLSPRLQSKWNEIHTGPKGRVLEVLDSTRNRMEPFFASPVLRRIFGSTETTLDIHALRREAKIVVLNPSSERFGDVLDQQLADTIGSVFINELFRSAHAHRREPYPTYVFLDEFQNFVAPDLGDMLPAVRQLGLRLILSHQSFSQLKKGEADLSAIIFQCQNRLTFGLQGPDDADLMAQELAACTFDENKIKHIQWSWRQLLAGFDKEILKSGGKSRSFGDQWSEGQAHADSRQETLTFPPDMFGPPIISRGTGASDSRNHSTGGSEQSGTQSGWHEAMVPQYLTFQEPRITFQTFEEWRRIWGRELRRASTGHAMLQAEGDPEVHHLHIHEDKPAYLKYDFPTLAKHFPQLIEARQQLIEHSFSSGLFLPAHVIDAQAERRIQQVLSGPTSIPPPQPQTVAQSLETQQTPPKAEAVSEDPDPFDGGFD